jgi:purine-nucleoside phosphorylase
MQPAADPHTAADRAAAEIAERTGHESHDFAVVLGSGWAAAADELGPAVAEFPTMSVTGFAPTAAEGHAGRIRSTDCNGRRCLVFQGRTHLYEGHGVSAVAHPIRAAAAAGCRTVVLTNSCGSLHPTWSPGSVALISDHINLTGATPLRGTSFVDMTEVYSPRLRQRCEQIDPSLVEGVYVQFAGPQYETPAEIRMARAIGGDLVGMSTALEAIAARAAGMEVLGISLVSNLAAGLAPEPLDHADVLAEGRAAAGRIGRLLARVIESL